MSRIERSRSAGAVAAGALCALAAAAALSPARAEAEEGYAPKLTGELTLRLEDSRVLPEDQTADWVGATSFGPEIKDKTLFNYNARFGVAGRLNPQLGYGLRLMFRNFKQPAFSFPAYEPGFGNSSVLADQFFLEVDPIDELSIHVGKHPLLLARNKNFFYDEDVQPVGATTQYKLSFWNPEGNELEHDLTFTAAQWFPTAGLRNDVKTVMFIEQVAYTLNVGGETGYELDAAVSATKFNGFDRFLKNAALGGATTSKVTTDASGKATLTTSPKLDFAKTNDPTLTGFNPLFIEAMVNATMKSLGGRPLTLQLGFVRNVDTAVPDGVTRSYDGADPNAYLVGISYGKLKKRFSWSVGYQYTHKGPASVVNGWTDDTLAGDLKGHTVTVGFVPVADLTLNVAWRFLQDADGLYTNGEPLPDALKNAHYSNVKLMLGAKF